MELNRQQRRIAKKQGLIDEQGAPVREARDRSAANRGGGSNRTVERTSPGDFVKEVRSELRKVAWPTRDEVINYSLVVAALVITLTGFIAALDFGLGEGVLALFDRR